MGSQLNQNLLMTLMMMNLVMWTEMLRSTLMAV
jgi:hypothetical protein